MVAVRQCLGSFPDIAKRLESQTSVIIPKKTARCREASIRWGTCAYRLICSSQIYKIDFHPLSMEPAQPTLSTLIVKPIGSRPTGCQCLV